MLKRWLRITALFVGCFSLMGTVLSQADLPTFVGKIAIIGSDYNVYVLDGASGLEEMLTHDAGAQGDEVQLYQWPTWSTDGRLAYFRTRASTQGQIFQTDIFSRSPGDESGRLIFEGERYGFNYAYWSPHDCADQTDCRDLAVLFGGASGLFVELVRDSAEPSSTTVGSGAPFYFSWSPDGTRMFIQRNQALLDIYQVDGGEIINSLPEPVGAFLSPGWSPVDDRLLYGIRTESGNSTNLVIRDGDTVTALEEDLAGGVSFAWSPDASAVAYTESEGALIVRDAANGDVLAQTAASGVIAFFWAPDSRKIALVTVSTLPTGSFEAGIPRTGIAAQTDPSFALLWSVLDLDTGETRQYTRFVPSREMIYMLLYFSQFAQSHRVWSPDSRHLIYGEVTQDNQFAVTIMDVLADTVLPYTVADGFLGVWSFE